MLIDVHLLGPGGSRWHRLDPARADGLRSVARLLLDAGADLQARTGGQRGPAPLG